MQGVLHDQSMLENLRVFIQCFEYSQDVQCAVLRAEILTTLTVSAIQKPEVLRVRAVSSVSNSEMLAVQYRVQAVSTRDACLLVPVGERFETKKNYLIRDSREMCGSSRFGNSPQLGTAPH